MQSREPSQLDMFQLRPPCLKCGGTTAPACVEPAQEADSDLRTFECKACGVRAAIKIASR